MISIYIKEAGYVQGQAVLQNINFTLPVGKLMGSIGANGAGKSTTIQSMMGMIPYFQGIHMATYQSVRYYMNITHYGKTLIYC